MVNYLYLDDKCTEIDEIYVEYPVCLQSRFREKGKYSKHICENKPSLLNKEMFKQTFYKDSKCEKRSFEMF